MSNNIVSGSSLVLGGGTLLLTGATTAAAPNVQAFNTTTSSGGYSVVTFAPTIGDTVNLDLGTITHAVGGSCRRFHPAQRWQHGQYLHQHTQPHVHRRHEHDPRRLGPVRARRKQFPDDLGHQRRHRRKRRPDHRIGQRQLHVGDLGSPRGRSRQRRQRHRRHGLGQRRRSIRSAFSTAAATGVTVTGTTADTITIASGGILETAAVGNNAVSFTGGSLTSGNGTDLIVNQFNSQANPALTIGSSITGAIGLTKVGPGNLTLSGANSYTGPTYLAGGVTSISAVGNLGAPTVAANEVLTLSNATLQATNTFSLTSSGTGTANFAVSLAGGNTFDVTGANTLTVGGIISGPGSLTKTDSGTLTLNAAETYTGGTFVNGGTLIVGTAGSMNLTGGAPLFVSNGGTLLDNNSAFGNNNLPFSGGTVWTLQGTGALNSATIKAGTLTVAESTPSVFLINGGTLTSIAGTNTSNFGSFYLNGNTVTAIGSNNQITAVSIGLGNAIFNTPSVGDSLAISSALGQASSIGTITKNGLGTLTLTTLTPGTTGDINTTTTVNAGTLTVGPGGSTGVISGSLTINSGAIVNASTSWSFGFNGAAAGVNTITINGGTLNFTGSNTGGGLEASGITMTGGLISGSQLRLVRWHHHCTPFSTRSPVPPPPPSVPDLTSGLVLFSTSPRERLPAVSIC